MSKLVDNLLSSRRNCESFFLEIIACPICNGKLFYNQNEQELICKRENLAFPVRDGIPVLLETEARFIPDEECKL